MEPFDFYLLRSPKFPLKVARYINTSESVEDLTLKLRQIYRSKEVQEAIYLASPTLYAELVPWTEPNGVISEKVLLSLYQYIIRMSTRCTPFGLFSGILLGSISSETPSILRLEGTRQHIKYDMNYLSKLASSIVSDKNIKDKVRYRPNNSIYYVEHFYRYYEFKIEGGKHAPYIIAVKRTPLLQLVLSKAAFNPTLRELEDSIVQLGIEKNMANSFLAVLIQRQVLVSEFAPNLTGKEYFNMIEDKVDSNKAPLIYECIQSLNKLKKAGLGFIERTKEIKVINEKLNVPHISNKFFCVNQIYAGQNHINKNTIKLLGEELQELSPFYIDKRPNDLTHFKEKFLKTYDREFVPLMIALDHDYGIGYGDSKHDLAKQELLHGFDIYRKAEESKNLDTINQFILKKFLSNKANLNIQMVIKFEDIEKLSQQTSVSQIKRPATFYAMGSLLSNSQDKIDEGAFSFNLTTISGPSALNLMSRFAEGEKGLFDKLKECADYEQYYYKNAIVAEVIHIPEAGVANILKRPLVRDYEILLLNCTSASSAEKITVDDLLIGVNNDRIILWSKKYDKQVIPRMSTAHNYRSDTALYKLLCDLQYEDLKFSFKWDWGILDNHFHLPRVVYKHLILSRERWMLGPETIIELENIKTKTERDTFRNRYKLPQRVLLSEGDNELLLDFYCPLSLSILRNKLKKGSVILYEFLFNQNESPVQDEMGNRYSNELIIPFKSVEKKEDHKFNPLKGESPVERKFMLGSEWLSFKLYCNEHQSDIILQRKISQIVNELLNSQLIDEWFFVRYYDPNPHLRIRFKIPKNLPSGLSKIVPIIHRSLKDLVNVGSIKNIVFDVYKRELERYSPKHIENTEFLFFRDSEMILHTLKHLGFSERVRWIICCFAINQLLDIAIFSLQEKFEWVSKMAAIFFNEFSSEEKLKYKLDQLYRQKKKELNDFLVGKSSEIIDYSLLEKLSLNRREALNNLLKDLKKDSTRKSFNDQLGNYSHMFINKVFSLNQRRYELIIYHFLSKHYRSLLALQSVAVESDSAV